MKTLLKKSYSMLPLKVPVFQALRRAFDIPERYYKHLHFKGDFTVQVDESASFLIRHYGYQVENDLFWAGYGKGWEGASLRTWAILAGSSNVILDIGANTGVYALAAQSVNPTARVFAFEPISRIAEKLTGNISLNNYPIQAVVAGASDVTGHAIIYEPSTAHAYSASLDPTMLEGHADLVETQIPTVRVSDFAQDHGLTSIDLVKLDAEKHEEAVLTGFGNLIEMYRPVFLIEILNRELGISVERFFENLQYSYFEIDDVKGISEAGELGRANRNYLVCPSEKIELLSPHEIR